MMAIMIPDKLYRDLQSHLSRTEPHKFPKVDDLAERVLQGYLDGNPQVRVWR